MLVPPEIEFKLSVKTLSQKLNQYFDQVRLEISHLMEASTQSIKFLIQFAHGSLRDQTSNLMVTIPEF